VSEIHTLELPKLPQKSDGALLWSWLKFFKIDSEEDLNMVSQLDPVINEIGARLLEISIDESTRRIAESREKLRRDQLSRLNHARKEGEAEGRARGEERALIKLAEKLLKRGESVDFVLDLTRLEYAKIKHLVEKSDN
jgi:predicted transposase/invertase (TIGR01784 family)